MLSAFFDKSADPTPQLAKMLNARGYQVIRKELTLAALRTLPEEGPIGILYLASHALSDEEGTDTGFSLATMIAADETFAETRQRENDQRKKLVEEKTLNEVVGRNERGDIGIVDQADEYPVNNEFFKEYWREKGHDRPRHLRTPKKIFADSSLVFITGCDVRDEVFLNLCKACGAGTILAWDNLVRAEVSIPTATYIFDRLLGTNVQDDPLFYPETLPQRPFEWGMVLQDMRHFKSPGGQPLGGPYFFGNPADRHAWTQLKPHIGPNCAGPFLTPAISFLRVDESKKRLDIVGRFGPDLGENKRKVMFYDRLGESSPSTAALEITRWTETIITCVLKPETAGYVVVEADGRTSNCIPLTEWRGTIEATATGDDSLQETCTISFSLRMDAHRCRMLFNTPASSKASYENSPTQHPVAWAAAHSRCASHASGSATYSPPNEAGLSKQSVSGQADIPPASAVGNGRARIGVDVFDVLLTIASDLDANLKETHDLTLTATLPMTRESPYLNKWTKTRPREGTKIEDLSALRWFSFSGFGNLVKVEHQTSYALPPPVHPTIEASGGPWKKAKLTMTSEVRFPPDPKKGEDYLSVV